MMPAGPAGLSALVMEEVLSIWKDYDPVEGYAAGFEDCRGRLFIPTETARADLWRRIENARSRLSEIEDEELRTAANKLLSCINVTLASDSPDEQIFNCSLALWYSILKGEQREAFVLKLLEQGMELVSFEHTRWQGLELSGERRKACLDACSFLESILIILVSENRDAAGPVGALSAGIHDYRSLFSFPVRHPYSFDELFAFLEMNAGDPSENRFYQQILDHVFDYGASAGAIQAENLKMLAEELDLAADLASQISDTAAPGTAASIGETYELLSKRYEIRGSVVAEAQKMMVVLNKFVDGYIQDLGHQPSILPEATPPFLKPLVTSGATIALDYIKAEPMVRIYVTEEKNTSWLTLLNVLVHEAAHAYHPSILAAQASHPSLLKLRSWLAIPLSEAVAFHRELELFEAVKEGLKSKRGLRKAQKELLKMFDTPKFPLRDDLLAFEFETRVWRIIRALRTICDTEVNSGRRTYVEFIKWASAHTGLTREFIHNECFTFLSFPGYTPSYSFCGSQYAALQARAAKRGVSRFAFNTAANQMGLLPWTACVKRMKKFRPVDKTRPLLS
jgi:hypothetical protein